ncbi:hypothetical protein MMC28_003811 [Mycoblastus sanguinarius]|nr:hypothetical protein [Mycoblastus sanguinarius]
MFSNANGGDEGADNNDMNLAERPDEEESYSSRHTRMSAQELAQSTRHEREVALYQHFRTLGAPMVPLNDAKGPQSQSDVLPLGRTSLANCSLFLHLERIGAFEECELPSDLRRVESDRELRSRLAREGLDVPDSVSAPDNMRQALGAKKLWGLLRERGFVYWPGEGWRLN